jgi:hypothetical protein
MTPNRRYPADLNLPEVQRNQCGRFDEMGSRVPNFRARRDCGFNPSAPFLRFVAGAFLD